MIELKSYQEDAKGAIIDTFKQKKRALVVMATGLGKTIVAANYFGSDTEKRKKGLYLCHTTGILDQSIDEFQKVLGSSFSLKPFYGNKKDWDADKADVVFATFKTLQQGIPFFKDEFSSIIVDESHRSQAPTHKEVIEYFDTPELLGLTATPDRMDKKDIREIFGEEVVNYPLEESVINGWLSPIEYHVMNGNLSRQALKELFQEIMEDGKRVSLKQLNENLFIKNRDIEISKIIQKHCFSGKKALIFCEGIPHANDFVKYLPSAKTYHSETDEKGLEEFRNGKTQFLVTVNKCNEGIDVPDAEVIIFLRCTDSKTIFFQQLGRGLRKFEGKEKVVVLDFVANYQRILFLKDFSRKLKILSDDSRPELDKNILKISGKNFTFSFSDEQLDILEILRKIRTSRLFISAAPLLSKEFSSKNCIPSDQVAMGSTSAVWWECSICNHEWKAQVNNRAMRGDGCPSCYGRVANDKNNLAQKNPELLCEYSPKNKLPAHKVVAGTNKKLWWVCSKCNHEWETTGANRVNGSGCPACANRVATETNNLAITHPKLSLEYSPKNKLPANKVIASTQKKLWWICSKCGYEWKAVGYSRTNGIGCPSCSGNVVTKINNLAVVYPHLASEYSLKNELPVNKIFARSTKKLWWVCKSNKHHEWQETGARRAKGANCPYCIGKVLTVTHPELSLEYSPKNELPANKVITNTPRKKLWWICSKCNHEWEETGLKRINGKGCPSCNFNIAKKIDNLNMTHPKLAKEYSSKNRMELNDVSYKTKGKFWWTCSKCNHEWKALMYNRSKGIGCPICARKKRSQSRKSKFYSNWQDARKATIIININNKTEYKASYKKDSKLPSNPNTFYEDWPGWKIFWGK